MQTVHGRRNVPGPAMKVFLAVSVLGAMGALLAAQGQQAPPSGQAMIEAAQKFLAALPSDQKAKATFAFDDPERLNWHFIPRARKGLPMKDMDAACGALAQQLLASGLSKSGYEQALSIMSLEEVLYLLEGGDREARRVRRDPKNYYITIFGTPAKTGRWGWRYEGHHLSLNYVVDNGEVVSSTPEFFGTNPALIDAGPGRAIRVLGAEEDIARQILKLCTPEQAKVLHVDTKAPDDLRGGGVVQPEVSAAVGLSYAKMSADQKKLLGDLLNEYLANMPADISAKRRDLLTKAGLDGVYFAWWGDADRNQRHYYRVQGPTFLIEYNNTQNNANHVHSYWRDLAGDFGLPIKK